MADQDPFERIKIAFNDGEFFRAYDLALEAHLACPEDERFAHRAVLSLANAGATELACASGSSSCTCSTYTTNLRPVAGLVAQSSTASTLSASCNRHSSLTYIMRSCRVPTGACGWRQK